jgi:hypothetical protein
MVAGRGSRLRLQDMMGAGQGGQDVPYDQTNPAPEDVMAGAQAAGGGQADPYGGANVGPTTPGAQDPMTLASTMGAGQQDMAPNTDMLSDDELATVDSPDAPSIDDILSDPSLSPEDRAMIQQQILMAARRQAAGL